MPNYGFGYQPYPNGVQNQGSTGYICRPVTSREEALATPIDYMSAGIIMPDIAHGMIYVKRFNAQTGVSEFGDFAVVPPPTPKQEINTDYALKDDFNALNTAFNELKAEFEKLKTPQKSKKENEQ